MTAIELGKRIIEEEAELKQQIEELVVKVKLLSEYQQQIFALQNAINCLRIDARFYFDRKDGVIL